MQHAARSASDGVVFLDRDGTINADVHYCRRPEDFRLLPCAAMAIALLNRNGMLVVVVTNQSGVSRGYFDWKTLEAIHEKLKLELARQNARVDAIYICSHRPDDGCDCRKPRPGLLLRAATDLGLELSTSYMVGDQNADVLAGQACGCKTVLVRKSPMPLEDGSPGGTMPDFYARDLYEAAQWIVNHMRSHVASSQPST